MIRRLTRGLHNAAAINLATSSAACHWLRGLGVANVHLWRRGVDLRLFSPERRDAASRESLGAGPDRVLALNVGRMSKEKELHRLEPLARDPGTVLALVGEGPAREPLRHQFAGMQVSFPGRLGGADLANAYAAADVFVFPSVTEVNALVLLEAMATGLPVLAADSPASRELLQAHPHCRLFSPDAPESLPGVVRELVAADRTDPARQETRRLVESCSWFSATRQLLGFYRTARQATYTATAAQERTRRAG